MPNLCVMVPGRGHLGHGLTPWACVVLILALFIPRPARMVPLGGVICLGLIPVRLLQFQEGFILSLALSIPWEPVSAYAESDWWSC